MLVLTVFLSILNQMEMGYDRGNSFPFDFEPNENPFGSKSKEKLSPRSYPIQFDRKSNTSFLSAALFVIRLRCLWQLLICWINSIRVTGSSGREKSQRVEKMGLGQ